MPSHRGAKTHTRHKIFFVRMTLSKINIFSEKAGLKSSRSIHMYALKKVNQYLDKNIAMRRRPLVSYRHMCTDM